MPATDQIFDTITGKESDKQLSVPIDNTLWYLRDQHERNANDKIIIPDLNPNKNNMSVVKEDEMITSNARYGLLKTSTVKFKNWFDNEENKILKLLMVVLIGLVISMFWYFHTTVRELRQQSQNGSNSRVPRSTDSNGSYGVESLDGGELSIIVIYVRLVVELVNWVVNYRVVDDLQMLLKCTNHDHKVDFKAWE